MAQNVIVYSTPFCSPCERLKKYLNEKGVSYVAVDLMMDEDAADMLEDKGIRASPVLEVDGQHYVGADLNPDNLAGLLGLA